MYMNTTDFIKNELSKFIEAFPQTKVRYEFDIDADIHCVEVLPNKIYEFDNSYISWERNFSDKFIDNFPDQNIYFFSEDPIVGIKHVDFELKGSEYVEIPNYCKSNIPLSEMKPEDYTFNNKNSSQIEPTVSTPPKNSYDYSSTCKFY